MRPREKVIGIIMVTAIATWVFLNLPGAHKKAPKVIMPIKKPATKPEQTMTVKKTEPAKGLDLERLVRRLRLKAESLNIESVRNPFDKVEPNISELEFQDLVLSGVLWDVENPLVVINDQVLRKGDAISSFQVEEIKQNEVVLVKDNERFSLKFVAEEEKE